MEERLIEANNKIEQNNMIKENNKIEENNKINENNKIDENKKIDVTSVEINRMEYEGNSHPELEIKEEDKASPTVEALPCIQLVQMMKQVYKLPDTDIRTYSPLTLAYIGDAIFDLVMRTIVVTNGNAPVNKLHQSVSKMVQATAQAELFHKIKDLLTEQEMSVYKRGRNAKSYTSAKNADIVDYRVATGLEALMGYLYITDQMDRLLFLAQPKEVSNSK